MSPIPLATPKRHGTPRTTPTVAPRDASMLLLGPGVMAATNANRTNATTCSVVTGVEPPGEPYERIPMPGNPSGSGGATLEQSCDESPPNWMRQKAVVGGIELFEAWLQQLAYCRHRHDTYAISFTESGVARDGDVGDRRLFQRPEALSCIAWPKPGRHIPRS